MRRILVLALLAGPVGCDRGEHRDAREKYNAGVEQLVKADYEAAEKSLLDARSTAGVDPDLRFRAAYDLGMAYAAHADKQKTGKDADLAKALELEQQAVSWFGDAARLKPEDADTKTNLSIVQARAAALSDELRRGETKLEARLDTVINDQRGVLDESRTAWLAIKQAGGADPLAQDKTLSRLADLERGIVAEVGVIGDLAADEIDEIGKKPQDKRKQDEQIRVAQLKSLDLYLVDGRGKIAEARRKLQDLAAEEAVGRAEAALVSLKRAREQLLDPITVLREVARDELQLMQETHAVSDVRGGTGNKLFEKAAEGAEKVIPAWMEPPVLGERQGGLHDRVEEVRTRVAAGVENIDKPVGTGSAAEPPKLTPEQAKMIERLKVALPLVAEASKAMETARAALADKKVAEAVDSEREALSALARAIEQFADLKQTIDLAWETQKQVVGLLSPEGEKQVPGPERATTIKDGYAQNTARMARIKDLISDEVAQLGAQEQQLEAKASAPAAAGSGAGSGAPDPKQLEAAKQQLAQMKQRLSAAETLRGDAEKALGELGTAFKANKDPKPAAKQADAKLEELRKLFFSVIEHLQELVRQQGETRDQTSQASGEDDFTRGPKLPGLVTREDEHGQMAKAITDALAKQADEAAKQPGQPQQQQGGPDPKSLSAAAAEVRLAQTDMTDSKTAIDKAQSSKTQSVSLKPAVDSQGKAIEHLQNALKLLQPPPKDNKDKQDQQQQQKQQQQQQQKDKKDDKDKQQQQGGAGQRARDEDAKRQRDKQKREGDSDPVDKDW